MRVDERVNGSAAQGIGRRENWLLLAAFARRVIFRTGRSRRSHTAGPNGQDFRSSKAGMHTVVFTKLTAAHTSTWLTSVGQATTGIGPWCTLPLNRGHYSSAEPYRIPRADPSRIFRTGDVAAGGIADEQVSGCSMH